MCQCTVINSFYKLTHLILMQYDELDMINILISLLKKLRPRKIKLYAQGHLGIKYNSGSSNLGRLAFGTSLFCLSMNKHCFSNKRIKVILFK